MPEQTTQSISIDAVPSRIMAVIADFEHYPSWASSVRTATVLATGPDGRARRVEFALDAGIVRDTYRLDYVWSGDARVDWELVESGEMMRAQTGSYVLTPESGGATEVTYTLAVELAMPMLGQLKRKAERIVVDQALHELKRRVETASGPG
jgi:ribosome-associated toxin RatA of RatAB toxin-antitoxin module